GLSGDFFDAVNAIEFADHPVISVALPIHRRFPGFVVNLSPSFREPPAKIFVAAIADEFEILAVADGDAIEREILNEHGMRGLFVIVSEFASRVAEQEQPAFYLRHSADLIRRAARAL